MTWLRIALWRSWTFVRQRPWALSVGLVLLLVEIFTPRSASFWILVGVTVLVAAKEVIDVGYKVSHDLKKIVAIKPTARAHPLSAPYHHPYNEWQTIERDGRTAVHHPELNLELANDTVVEFDKNPAPWHPASDRHEAVRRLKVPTLDVDEDKVRLETDLVPGTTRVRVRRTPYSAFLVTNRLASLAYREKGTTHEYIEFPDGETVLPRLPLSACSNHLGADVLAISEGRIFLQRQTEHNVISPGLVLSSGSGSADWRDLDDRPSRWRRPRVPAAPPARCRDLGAFVRHTMWREMAEEMGLGGADRHGPEDVKIVGYARFTPLGGKPQFYGVASLGPVQPRIKGRDRRYTYEHLAETFDPAEGVAGLLRALADLERRFDGEMAFSLVVNIELLRQWLLKDPLAAAAFLKLG